ncbi:MAG TPA: alpha/beta hydrolase [Acidimicrobiales bacterium]|nr:alpha/beta hydrolase [Acidimicrobiales bacterium]
MAETFSLTTSATRVGPYMMHAAHYLVAGAPDVVAVHGMVVAGHGVAPLARAMAQRGLSVHVPDLPGFGRSDKPRRALDVDGLASTLSGWTEARGLRHPVVVGNSFGTQVATAHVADHHGSACSLVLLSPTIDPRLGPAWLRRLPRGRPGGRPRGGAAGRLRAAATHALVPVETRRPAALRSLLVREYLASGLFRALSTVRHALNDDMTRRLPRVGVPVLVLRGEQDGNVSAGWAETVADACPAGSVEVVPGTDHDAQFNAPDMVAEAVARFVAGGAAMAGPAAGDARGRDTPRG